MATDDVPVDLYVAAYADPDRAQQDWDAIKQLVKDKVLTVEASVAARQSYGGTAPANVLVQAARWKTLLTGQPHEPRPLGRKKHGGHGDGGLE